MFANGLVATIEDAIDEHVSGCESTIAFGTSPALHETGSCDRGRGWCSLTRLKIFGNSGLPTTTNTEHDGTISISQESVGDVLVMEAYLGNEDTGAEPVGRPSPKLTVGLTMTVVLVMPSVPTVATVNGVPGSPPAV